VTVYEVGPRDGLQNEAESLPVEVRAELVDRLTDAGLRAIEVGSFVSPKAIPQLADTEELYRRIHPASGVRYPALVPNLRGLERALEAGVREIAVFTAATETFTAKNVNAGVDESIERFRRSSLARARSGSASAATSRRRSAARTRETSPPRPCARSSTSFSTCPSTRSPSATRSASPLRAGSTT
jgi:isopropylmalate/homocitrate/citramalate synthase